MLVAWIIVVLLVGSVVAVASLRRRSHDDEHSVQGYHRQIHTLEEIGAHPAKPAGEEASFPEVAFRVSTHSTVRLTEPGKPVVPPVPPPPVADPSRPVTFDDAGPVISTPSTTPGADWREDKAMQGINHRPRRLAAPAAAVGVVAVVIVVLLVTGSHKAPPPHHATVDHQHHQRDAHPDHQCHAHQDDQSPWPHGGSHHHSTVTTTTVAPVVSLPSAGSPNSAVYAVKPTTYTLAMSATSSYCWVQATEAGSGYVLYSGTLTPGQTESVTVTGAVSLIVGAPDTFAANINGTSVSFPFGFQAPFTMEFLQATSTHP